MNVLITEDTSSQGRKIVKVVRDLGYTPSIAGSGKEAWDQLLRSSIRIAILNWNLAGTDGARFCRKIRRELRERYIYVILVAAEKGRDDIVRGLMAGADDYIILPVDPLELKARLLNGQRIIGLESRLLRIQKRLHELATQDCLTRTLNRDAILLALDEEIARAERENFPLSTIILDVDDFKKINDAHGHQVGDKVLQEISWRLKKILRCYDKIGRYGGDELLIVLPNCNLSNLEQISGRLCESIHRAPVETPAGALPVTISLGGTSTEALGAADATRLIIKSDVALYEAKRKGRDQWAVS